MGTPGCPFCERIEAREADGELAVAFPDAYPITDGHTLVVPTRHVESVFDLEPAEHQRIWALVLEEIDRLRDAVGPDGFNVGFNSGVAAGQTVNHAHVHVIPRRDGDTEDPRGGVRRVVPERAAYWET